MKKRRKIVYCYLLCAIGVLSCQKNSHSTANIPGDSEDVLGDSGVYENGEYDDGFYHCCAKGDGTSCCEGYEPIGESAMCFEYGGIYGDCRAEGELLERKIICAICCEGLVIVQNFESLSKDEPIENPTPEICETYEDIDSLMICTKCGDGNCGLGEDVCNCPADCLGTNIEDTDSSPD